MTVWSLALAAFLAGSVVPFPAEAVLAGLVAAGRDPAAMAAVATVANLAGAVTLLWIGRAGRPFAERRAGREALQAAERRFSRWGAWLLLLSWVPIVGDPLVLAAGLLRVRWAAALPLLAAGKAARYAAVAAGAAWLRSAT